jgi:putative tryptophan/tyrosine transport system substrate-binding protein
MTDRPHRARQLAVAHNGVLGNVRAAIMRRREFITLTSGAAVVWPLAVYAQQAGRPRRIGLLTRKTDASVAAQIDAFREGLRDLGWVEGKTISIEHRDADGQVDRLRPLAEELVGLNVDAIVTVDTPPTQAAERATNTIPIIIAVSADPVAAGLVQSLAHPGGNTTGLSLLAPETDEKTLELLKETLPRARRVAMIFDPKNQGMMLRLQRITAVAPKLAIELQSIPALSPNQLADALTAAAKTPPDALIVLSPIYAAYRDQIEQFVTKTKVPLTMDTSGLSEEPGALLSYGADISDLFRRAASFVDKILKGAKPADLPVEQPVKFDFVINLKTATALGLDVPPTVLMRTDKVIE